MLEKVIEISKLDLLNGAVKAIIHKFMQDCMEGCN